MATPIVVDRVVEMTRQLFSGSVSLATSRDPEFPQDEFLVLTVEPAGEIDDLLGRERQWIRRLAAIAPGLGTFRLAIHPRESVIQSRCGAVVTAAPQGSVEAGEHDDRRQ